MVKACRAEFEEEPRRQNTGSDLRNGINGLAGEIQHRGIADPLVGLVVGGKCCPHDSGPKFRVWHRMQTSNNCPLLLLCGGSTVVVARDMLCTFPGRNEP